jgi:hypothetical protein
MVENKKAVRKGERLSDISLEDYSSASWNVTG